MNDMMVENPMILPFPEPKQIREVIDEVDLAGLKKAADLLEEITDEMNTDLEKPFRDELWKIMDSMNARIEALERAGYNPFSMIDFAAKVCGIGGRP